MKSLISWFQLSNRQYQDRSSRGLFHLHHSYQRMYIILQHPYDSKHFVVDRDWTAWSQQILRGADGDVVFWLHECGQDGMVVTSVLLQDSYWHWSPLMSSTFDLLLLLFQWFHLFLISNFFSLHEETVLIFSSVNTLTSSECEFSLAAVCW